MKNDERIGWLKTTADRIRQSFSVKYMAGMEEHGCDLSEVSHEGLLEEIENEGLDILAYVHELRRRWNGGDAVKIQSPRRDSVTMWGPTAKAHLETIQKKTKMYGSDAGVDLIPRWVVSINRSPISGASRMIVSTGVCFNIPNGMYGHITSRSSTWNKIGARVDEGVIDSGYTGETFVFVTVPTGIDAIIEAVKRMCEERTPFAQILFINHSDISKIKIVDGATTDGGRGSAGWGSTDEVKG
jgi:dUTPase